MDPTLRLQPGQQQLTPEQETEAKRFAQARIQAQLSTEPVDEPEAEAFLRRAYQVAGLAPPKRIHLLDGPLQLVAVLAAPSLRASVGGSVGTTVWLSLWSSPKANVRANVEASVWSSLEASVRDSFNDILEGRVGDSLRDSIGDNIWPSVRASVDASRITPLAPEHLFKTGVVLRGEGTRP